MGTLPGNSKRFLGRPRAQETASDGNDSQVTAWVEKLPAARGPRIQAGQWLLIRTGTHSYHYSFADDMEMHSSAAFQWHIQRHRTRYQVQWQKPLPSLALRMCEVPAPELS
jgi:hypothetical protein